MNYKVLISLGSNLGDRKLAIEQAITEIHETLGTVLAIAPLYETPSWGYEDAPYLNNAICLTTDCTPLALMEALLDIEKQLGRMRTDSLDYQARQIDIDIALIDTATTTASNTMNAKRCQPVRTPTAPASSGFSVSNT